MSKYLFFTLFLLMSCHQRANYLAIDDGMILDKKTGDIFEVKPERNPPIKYVGNLKEFRKDLPKK